MYPLFLSDFNETWIFSTDFRKRTQIYNISSKFVQWESSCFMRTDRQTDRWTAGRTDGHDEANSRFSQFCEMRLRTVCTVLWNVMHFKKARSNDEKMKLIITMKQRKNSQRMPVFIVTWLMTLSLFPKKLRGNMDTNDRHFKVFETKNCNSSRLHTFHMFYTFHTVRYGKLLEKRLTNAPVSHLFVSFICTYMFQLSPSTIISCSTLNNKTGYTTGECVGLFLNNVI
jgi:hypothetical protein